MPDVASLSLQLLADRLDALAARPPWQPYPWQTPPGVIATHGLWLIEGGRGIGKTDGCARYVDDHVNGPPCDPRIPGGHRVAIVAPTLDDAAESCVTGPSGLQAHNQAIRLRTMLGGSKAIWPSGAEAKLFSGNDKESVERLRAGGNRCLVWVEEAAAMRYLGDVLKQSRYGLRLGDRAHMVGSSTPKTTVDYKALRADPRTARTHGTTEQAVHLDPAVRDSLYKDYAGTRLGRQELLGELLEDVEGALWTYDEARANTLGLGLIRHVDTLPSDEELGRRVLSVDPSDGEEDSDEYALTVVIAHSSGALYVPLSDGVRLGPEGNVRHTADVFDAWGCDVVVVEKNHGGGYLPAMLRREGLPVQVVTATQGKRTRAEPAAREYGPSRPGVFHVGKPGTHQVLETQQTSFTGQPGEKSPDRLDSLVWGVWAHMNTRRRPRIVHAGRAVA